MVKLLIECGAGTMARGAEGGCMARYINIK